MTVNVDFTRGEVNSFVPSGSPSYNDDGVAFTVAQGGDAPQLSSLFYIMFGRVEITMKAAPGAGIVSSLVLESDTLDEIDIEWLGADADEIQSNYFGKGQVTTYNRGQFHEVVGTQSEWITYTVDWTEHEINWIAGGTVVRTLKYDDAEENQYPQTPMRVKFGSWSGGDANHNAPGTVSWARGPTDYSQGPFTMAVKSVIVTDYSTGKEYKYTDNSGSWGSIEAVDGEVNGNVGNEDAVTVTATAAGTVATSDGSVPVGGIGDDASEATATNVVATAGALPEGWIMTDEGKIMPDPAGAASGVRPHVAATLLAPLLGALILNRRAV
jgi:beta-glucanase (GH16 family)